MSEKIMDKCEEKELRKKKLYKYSTRFIFTLLLVSGLAQIATGLHFLTQCRREIKVFMCGIMTESEPCSKLAVPTYFGCAVILTTIFGFGCVGRRSTGIIIFVVLLAEIGTGIYFKIAEHTRVFYKVWDSLTDATEMCYSSPESKDFKKCWLPMLDETPQCISLKQKTERKCTENYFTGHSLDIGPYEKFIHSCTEELSMQIDASCNSKMNTVAVFMLVASVFYIAVSCSLVYLHRKDRKKGFSLVSDNKSNSSTDATEHQDLV